MSSSAARGLADQGTGELQAACSDGTAQPHGLVLVVREPQWRVVQASTNATTLLRRPLDTLLLATLRDLGGDLEAALRARLSEPAQDEPRPLRCRVGHGEAAQAFEGAAHRVGNDAWLIELEPLGDARAVCTADLPGRELLDRLGSDVQGLSTAESVVALADGVAASLRALLGHKRVVVYELPVDGPGKVIAEASDGASPAWLGQALPLLELPPAWRAHHLRQRVQVVADARAEPCELVPRMPLGPEAAFDLSRGLLQGVPAPRRNALLAQGVCAALSAAIVREGRLWGVVAALHDEPRHVGPALRAAVELLAEVMATRIAAIESYARAQVALQVQRLEQRMLEANSNEGDWRRALFDDPLTLLKPLAASGALLCHEGEVQSCGDVPPAHDLPLLLRWLDGHTQSRPWHCESLMALNPALSAMAGRASGVLCVRLSATPRHLLVWLRQPHVPLPGVGALPWTGSDIELAAALGHAVADLIVQVDAVRMLIAEKQLSRLRATVASAQEAVVVVADGAPTAFYANEAFYQLAGRRRDECATLDALTRLCTDSALAQRVIGHVRAEQRAWQGELALRRPDGSALPVAVRAEPVPARHDGLLGAIFIFQDLSASKRAEAARMHLEAELTRAGRAAKAPEGRALVGAIIANASLAAMDIADGGAAPAATPLLQEVQASTARATALFERIRTLAG